MLVLSRKVGEQVLIGGSVIVTVVAAQGRTVKIGIKAPPDVGMFREELIGRSGRHAEAVRTPVGGCRNRSRGTTQDGRSCA
jgi:carbon storage regulator